MGEELSDLIEAADLLGFSKGQKEVPIKLLGNKKVVIKKVTIGELADIMKVAKDNEIEQYILLVFKGLVKPKLKLNEVRALNHALMLELALHISKFSGLDRDSLGRLENLLGTSS